MSKNKTLEINVFAIVPVEILQDKRLTLEQMRVLIALLSFRGKDTDVVWPSRDALAERTGIHPANVSAATTALVELGWLRKKGSGGKSSSCRYRITVPEKLAHVGKKKPAKPPRQKVADSATEKVARSATSKVADSATQGNVTVADSATSDVAESARGYVAHSATQTVADSARGKEHTIEHTNEHTSEHTNSLSTTVETAAVENDTETALQIACRKTWSGYSAAFQERYGIAPVRNAKVNASVKSFVQRIGHDDAPAVAEFFVWVNDAFLVRTSHDFAHLTRSAETFWTQWKTGKRVTQTQARQIDKTASNRSAVDEAKEILRNRKANVAAYRAGATQ